MGLFEYTAEKLRGATVADKWRVFARMLEVMKHFENVPNMPVDQSDIHRAAKAANRIERLVTGQSLDPRRDFLDALEALGINPSVIRSILRP
jgi:hypothetical protein